jgi:ABC-type molybdate transport system substrate-binding protein
MLIYYDDKKQAFRLAIDQRKQPSGFYSTRALQELMICKRGIGETR